MSKCTRFSTAAIVNAAVLLFTFSGCDDWNKPLYYIKEGLDATRTIYIDPYPCPNTFFQGETGPADNFAWEDQCGFYVWGIKGDDTKWIIPPEHYQITGFNSDTQNKTVSVTVFYDDSVNGRLSTTFDIYILPKGTEYNDIERYTEERGSVIPFPSKAEAGNDIKVIVSAKDGYELVEGSLTYEPSSLSPPPPRK